MSRVRRSGGGGAGDPGAELDAQAFDLGSVADLKPEEQVLMGFAEQEDGEDPIVDDLAHELGDAIEEDIEFQGGI